jgi:hypothetical protein
LIPGPADTRSQSTSSAALDQEEGQEKGQEGQEAVANILQELISNQSNITSATLPTKSTPTRDLELTKPEGMFGLFK